ncbi:MAG: glycyl-radical enzyme activating protein [Oscillospiraceae bacterium]
MEAPFVFNIQKYSIHDGNGIRTTLFFKGCPLTCLWCHNPESQRFPTELMVYRNRCVDCGACIPSCPNNANKLVDGHLVMDRTLCNACGKCVDSCLQNAREIIGKTYTIKELVKEASKDMMFYEESGGGITLSGGEVMSQNIDYLAELCEKLYDKGFSVNIDTCGYAPYEKFKRILPFVDTFLYDIKLMDNEKHKKYIGVGNELILENLIKLNADGAKINVRIPIIAGVNDSDEFIDDTIKFLKDNKIRTTQINLLPYHNIAKDKYENLNRLYQDDEMRVPSRESMELFRDKFISHGHNNIKIGG